jgi:hypothetical protein
MNGRRRVSKLQRGLYLSAAAAFWLFLAASAPHRVHHFFEQFAASAEYHAAHALTDEHTDGERHGHDDHDRNHDQRPSQQNNCVVLSVAQNAHASLVPSFSFSVLECAVPRYRERLVVTASSFNPAPFSQRAPPLA